MLERSFDVAKKHPNNHNDRIQGAIEAARKVLNDAGVFDPEEEIFLTISEAAVQLNYHPAALRKLVQKGGIEATKRGREWYIGSDTVRIFTRKPPGRPKNPS